jgi:predicted HicB family RNase H-like nuclease
MDTFQDTNEAPVQNEERATSFLHIRATPSDKSAWVKAAKGQRKKLAQWVTEVLNQNASR